MLLEICGAPDPTRNDCHGQQVISYYASKAECEADIPTMGKREFKDFHIQEAGPCETLEVPADEAEHLLKQRLQADYYYQLYCSGPTGRGQHGCGGYFTLQECKAKGAEINKENRPPAKTWCTKESLCSGCEQFLKH
jgi:hypothetical protein